MQTIKLIDVCEFVRNGANIKQLSNETRGIPITRIETLANDRFNRDRLGYANITDDSFSGYYLKRGDVLLSHINGAKFIGRSVMYEPEEGETIIHGMNLLCLRFKSNYNPKFFCYYAKSKAAKNYFDKHTKKAVNQASITSTDIKNMPIPNLNLDEQNKIVDILDELFARSRLIESEQCLLDDLVESKFNEMFGHPFINDKKWDVNKLIEVVDVRDGTHDSPKYYSEGYPFVTSKNLVDGEIDFSACQLICEKDYLHFNERSKVDDGDILMPMIGTVGGAIIVHKDRDFAIKNVALIKTGTSFNINNIFLLALLNSKEMFEYFDDVKKGGTQQFISLGLIRNIPIIVPPIDRQLEFADFVKLVEKSKNFLKSENQYADELIEKKMSDYFFEYEED